jgi:predicted CoA-binding protein
MMKFFEGTIAVVGASDDPKRIAYTVFAKLQELFPYSVLPINPKLPVVHGVQAVATLDDITEQIDTLVMIVNPAIGISIVQEALEKGIRKFWFQPGSYGPELEQLLNKKDDVLVSFGACILHL